MNVATASDCSVVSKKQNASTRGKIEAFKESIRKWRRPSKEYSLPIKVPADAKEDTEVMAIFADGDQIPLDGFAEAVLRSREDFHNGRQEYFWFGIVCWKC